MPTVPARKRGPAGPVRRPILAKSARKKNRKACPACEEEGTLCPECQKEAAPTLERPPTRTQTRRGSPGEDPAERQADELGKNIGEKLQGTGSVGHGPLPKSVREVAEAHLGVSLEGTHIDAGSAGQKKAKDESALAVTEGKRIAFGEGQLSTTNPEGRNLLGHELVHVGQQATSDNAVAQRQTVAVPGPGGKPGKGKDCIAIFEKIRRIAFGRTGLETRYEELLDDPHDLYKYWRYKTAPHPIYGSWEGHLEAYKNTKKSLDKQLEQWKEDNCDKPPGPMIPDPHWRHDLSRARDLVKEPTPSSPRVKSAPRSHPVPSRFAVLEALLLLGLSLTFMALVIAALLDPDPLSKLVLAGMSLGLGITILAVLGIPFVLPGAGSGGGSGASAPMGPGTGGKA